MNPEEPIQRHFNSAVCRPFDTPSTWYEAVYREAGNESNKVPWARQTNQPLLLPWLELRQELAAENRRTLVVGCGLGDDAETLAHRLPHVTAFDISPRAIAWCRQRFPASRVAYQVADLLDLPEDFRQAFDLVYEALTIQSLPPNLHAGAIAAIADCVAPGGILLLMCYGRDPEEPTDGPPWHLARSELDLFLQHGLQEVCFQEHMIAGVRRFLVEYRKA
ncbi:class I SAM-dependent methyltransferase [Ktedonosporobacter rubrisoli]|nr:class I SAM-dependent methyltransferase [Ktedonosporobacter rubrisoli]